MNPTIPLRIHVEPERISTAPGEPFALTLSVFNTSDIIDGFDITVVGADQNWVVAEPDWISLFPDSEGTVNLKVTLPMDFRAGPHELGVKVTSRTTNEVFAVGAVELDISERTAARLEVDPDSVVAGKRGRYSIIVHNDGNVPIDVAIDAKDDGNVLAYDVTPTRIQLGPGQSRTCQLVVTAPRPITGTPAVRPFVVSATGPGVELVAPASFGSRPWIPRWLITFLAIALLLGLWAFIIGLALDAILDDMDQDLADAFEQGIASVVAAVAPGAGGGAEAGDVVTGPPGAVPGLVTAASDGTPVAGATASAQPLISVGSRTGEIDMERDPVEIATGDDGTFLYEDMVRGSYQLTVSASGYDTSDPVQIDIPFEGEPVLVELVGAPGLISGVVLAGGEPLQNASLVVRRLDPATGNAIGADGVITETPLRSTVTPETGRFALDELPTPATYELDVSSPGFTTMRVIVDLTPGQRLIGLELELAGVGAGAVTGNITDATTGRPLGGVNVTAAGDGLQLASTSLTTAANGASVGSYRLGGLPTGEYTATFRLAGYNDVAVPFSITAETPEVTLSPSMTAAPGAPIGALEGSVVDATSGSRLGGASISIAGEGGQFNLSSLTQAGDGLEVGSFRLQSLPIGSYTATFTLPNYDPVALPFTVTAARPTATLQAQMQTAANAPVGQLTGQVTDSGGQGVGGITVTVTGGGIELSTVTFTGSNGNGQNTGEAGSFIINAIPTGSYTATFSSTTYETVAMPFEITAAEPDPSLSPTITPKATTVTGSVSTVESGEGQWTYSIMGAAIRRGNQTLATTGADGRFTFSLVAPPGTIQLTVVADGFLTRTVEATIVPGTPLDLGDILVFSTSAVEGTFVDTFGVPLGSGGSVTLSVTSFTPAAGGTAVPPSEIPSQTLTMSDYFYYEGLPGAGEYTFRAQFTNGGTPFRQRYVASVTFSATVYQFSWLGDITVPYAARVIHGILTCQPGVPASNWSIAIATNPAEGPILQQITTDNDGRYSFAQVGSGSYYIGEPYIGILNPIGPITFPGASTRQDHDLCQG